MTSLLHLTVALLLALGAVPGIPPFGLPAELAAAAGPAYAAKLASWGVADSAGYLGDPAPFPSPWAQSLTTDLLATMASWPTDRTSIGTTTPRRAPLGSIAPPGTGTAEPGSAGWLSTLLDREWRSEHAADGSTRTRTLRGPPARDYLA